MAPPRTPLSVRFWRSVQVTDGCWEWQGSTRNGYGVISKGGRNGRQLKAHRLSYEMHLGSIPEGMIVCHTCDNPICVNPGHLFVGTHKDNAVDKMNKNRHYAPTHCPQGHEYDEENTWWRPNTKNRKCRACGRERQRHWRAKNPDYQSEWRAKNPDYQREYRKRS